jgi:hypothetical protein
MIAQTNEIQKTIQREMRTHVFLYIKPDLQAWYRNPRAKWDRAVQQFPSIATEVDECSRCLALERNTASVFHLMRVLEIGLGALGKRFDVSSAHTNWETILNQIEKAIATMDQDPNRPANWKDEREFYSQCASHFRVLKDAWRNYTAHARGKYDAEEAHDILTNVRGFMQKLSTKLAE